MSKLCMCSQSPIPYVVAILHWGCGTNQEAGWDSHNLHVRRDRLLHVACSNKLLQLHLNPCENIAATPPFPEEQSLGSGGGRLHFGLRSRTSHGGRPGQSWMAPVATSKEASFTLMDKTHMVMKQHCFQMLNLRCSNHIYTGSPSTGNELFLGITEISALGSLLVDLGL